MSEFKYNFPIIVKKISKRKQIEKIFEELIEFLTATEEEEKYMEWLDALHCMETFTRHHFDIEKLEKYKQKVIEKNAKRGYYSEKKNRISVKIMGVKPNI